MLAHTEERKITSGDIDQMIAEIDKGWEELFDIHLSCQHIRIDLALILKSLDDE
ncbi:hypothetical protein GCM10008018_23970 [Paenibacillus marchantiophytorum]|uniref:Uncharacterized protein n=1 Tax=Paenibacillus marchantiophytorum TaxID=1619310 RepID=A0ABQ1EMH7_9BACL|nr:hypothetical protein [Paenibacillus marchantiophytorum]GFZ77602.1 hypothetical protein GCM10008018_23970 [Paenibacillus marchantiophytorum]